MRRVVGELRIVRSREICAWAALADEPTLIKDNVNEHERVRSAVVRGDSEAARRWMSDHVRRAGDLVADWFEHVAQVGLDDEISEAVIAANSTPRVLTREEEPHAATRVA